jgi:hypothetical protein
MDTHEYVFVFQNLNILCIFSDRFFDLVFFRFFPGSGSVPVFWVDRFNDRSCAPSRPPTQHLMDPTLHFIACGAPLLL